MAKATTHVLIAHDTSVFEFEISSANKSPIGLKCLYKPERAERTYHAYYANEDPDCRKYLDLDTSTNCMIPVLYNNGQMERKFTKDDISKPFFEHRLQKFTDGWTSDRSARSVDICGSKQRIQRVAVKFGKMNEDDKFEKLYLEYIYYEFKGNRFEGAVVEYAHTQKSFLELCKTYNLYMFGDLSCSLSVVTSDAPIHQVGNTTITEGKFRDSNVYIKEGTVQTTGDFLNFFQNESRVQLQEGMPRIYEGICDGVKYQIAMEKCLALSLLISENNQVTSLKDRQHYWKLKEILQGAIRSLIYIHNEGLVHTRIRPQHILLSEYKPLRYTAKWGGLRCCTRVDGMGPEEVEELVNKDIYDMGRTIMATLDNEHDFPDDDEKAQNCYNNRDQFEQCVEKLCEKDPLVGHLVKLCLSCKIDAKTMHGHFCFYNDGTYLEFMQKFSDSLFFIEADEQQAKHEKEKIKRYNDAYTRQLNQAVRSSPGSLVRSIFKKQKVGFLNGRCIVTYTSTNAFDLVKLIKGKHLFSNMFSEDNFEMWDANNQ